MASHTFWALLTIGYQTVICIIISWMVLDCKLYPDSEQYHEVTVLKLLYLYDPEACGRIFFYNHTIFFSSSKSFSMVVWPVHNDVAAGFRVKLKLYLSLHIMWLSFGVMTATFKHRHYRFFLSVVPFTLTGIAMLSIDLIYMVLFLIAIPDTSTENRILALLNSDKHYLKRIIKPLRITQPSENLAEEEDMSWISLLFAFTSCRGVVQWVLNYWIVKDNFFYGLAEHRRVRRDISKRYKK